MPLSREKEHYDIVNGKRRRNRIDVIAVSGGMALASYVKASDMYDIPGGGLDKGETVEQSAVREAMEEAGWIVEWPKVVPVKSNTLFTGSDDRWYHNEGWDEELQIPMLCNAVRYKPDYRYSSEGDGRIFTLVSVLELISSYRRELGRTDIRQRRKIQAAIRIEVLQMVARDLNKVPKYKEW